MEYTSSLLQRMFGCYEFNMMTIQERRECINEHKGCFAKLNNGTVYQILYAYESYVYLLNSKGIEVETSISAINNIYHYNQFQKETTKIDKYERSIKVRTGNPKVRKRTRIRRTAISCRTSRARCERSNF